MSFKTDLIDDLDTIINADEFGEEILYSGGSFIAIVDYSVGYEDSFVDIVLTCKTSDVKNIANGTQVTIGTQNYKIINKSLGKNGITEVAIVAI